MPIVKHLLADTHGAFLGKFSERLKLKKGKETLAQAPLMHLRDVTIVGNGISISADAIQACSQRGIPIYFLSAIGDVYATIYAAGLVGTVITRRAQLAAYEDDRGKSFAQAIALAKITNQSRTLRYWARNRRSNNSQLADVLKQVADSLQELCAQLIREHFETVKISEIAGIIMGYEGQAARLYWQGVGNVIPEFYEWSGRKGRGATDPVNSLLNYGYGILYAEIERATVLAGLDPYGGFLHADRPGKPSLVLDFIEEFRQLVVDRTVVGLVTRNYKIEQDEMARLSLETRRDFARKITKQLDGKTRYRGKRMAVRHIIQNQARHLASFLRRDASEYQPYLVEE